MPKDTSSIAHECPTCGVQLNRASDLNRHRRVHDKNRDAISYVCTRCGYSALQKTNFVIHLRTHTKVKNQHCPSCPFRTGDPSTLLRHRKRLHKYVPRPYRRRARKANNISSTNPSPSGSLAPIIDSGPSQPPSSSQPPFFQPEGRSNVDFNPFLPGPLFNPAQATAFQPQPIQTFPALNVPQLQDAGSWMNYSPVQPTFPVSSSNALPTMPNNDFLNCNTFDAYLGLFGNGNDAFYFNSSHPGLNMNSYPAVAAQDAFPSFTPEVPVNTNNWFPTMPSLDTFFSLPEIPTIPQMSLTDPNLWVDFPPNTFDQQSSSFFFPTF